MSPRRIPLLSLTLLALVLLLAAPAPAQESVTETFDAPLGAGWEASPEVSVNDGRIVVPAGGFAFRGGAWTSIALGGFSYQGDGEALIEYAVGDGGQYILHFFDDRLWSLERTGSGELASAPGMPIEPSVPIDVTISFGDGHHTITVGGEQVLSAQDPEPLPPGGVAIRGGGERTITVDTVTLSGQETAPAEVTDASPDVAVVAPAAATTTSTAPAATPAGFTQRLQDLFGVDTTGSGIGEAAINLALAAVLAFILGRVYIHWGAALSNRRRFAANFMVVAVATTFIILVVRSSVALSLGLVGALSIVRFRAAIKDPEELTFMFLAIGIGIGLGDNQRLLTIIALGMAIIVVGLMRLFRESRADFNLYVTVGSDGPGVDPEAIATALGPYCTRIRLSRFDQSAAGSETAYLVEFAGSEQMHSARRALLDLSPDLSVTFLDDKGLW